MSQVDFHGIQNGELIRKSKLFSKSKSFVLSRLTSHIMIHKQD